MKLIETENLTPAHRSIYKHMIAGIVVVLGTEFRRLLVTKGVR